MTAIFRKLFYPPAYIEPKQAQTARILHLILMVALAYFPLILLAGSRQSSLAPNDLNYIAVLILIYLITYILNLIGLVRVASYFLPLSLWIYVSLMIYLIGGIKDFGITSFIVVVLITSMLHGALVGAACLVISVLFSLFVLLLEMNGLLPPPALELSPLMKWAIEIGVFFHVSVLMYFSINDLQRALKTARNHEIALFEINREHEEIRASLEAHTSNLERHIIQLQVAAEIAREAAAVDQVDVLLDRAVNLVRDRFGFYHAGIFLMDDQGTYTVLKSATGEAGRKMLEEGYRLKVGEAGIIGYVTGTGHHRVAVDVDQDEIHLKNPYLTETRSELTLPLKVGQQTIGALDVQSQQRAAFDHDDIVILQTMADQLAVAIENSRLFESAGRRLDELSALHAVASAAAAANSEDELVENATQIIADTLYPDNFGVMIVEKGQLLYHPSYREHGHITHNPVALGEGIVGKVAQDGEPRRVGDVFLEPEYINVDPQTRAELCVPIRIGSKIIGIINAESRLLNSFTADDQRLLLTFAEQMATGIEKIRHYEAERRRAAELEALRQASLHLTSNLELGGVLHAILEDASALVSADTANIFLFDGERLTHGTALRSHSQPAENLTDETRSQDQGLRSQRAAADPALYPEDTELLQRLAQRVAQTGERLAVADAQHSLLFSPGREIRAVVGLPLRRGSQVIGVMNLSFTQRPHIFDENELRVLSLLADQAAIALVNARLYSDSQDHAQELTVALAQREELVRLKNEFIQNVSHELRTPLAIARGYIELLATEELGVFNKKQQEAITVINRRINMLIKLVDDLVTILEAEALEVKHEQVNLCELVVKVNADFMPSAMKGQLNLNVQIPDGGLWVQGNSSHLSRLIDNLVGNAIKFTPPGASVAIQLERQADQAVLRVQDQGIGIPSEKIDRIFDRFYQVDGSTKRRFGGTGLGLSLVKEIAQSHHATISVDSEVGKGTTFTVRFPLLQESA